jgi:hypothetical protein
MGVALRLSQLFAGEQADVDYLWDDRGLLWNSPQRSIAEQKFE